MTYKLGLSPCKAAFSVGRKVGSEEKTRDIGTHYYGCMEWIITKHFTGTCFEDTNENYYSFAVVLCCEGTL